MADVSARAPVFSRGSGVLEYWLAHAEGLTVEPLGARVEKVVIAAPAGRAERLIVRSRMTRRRTEIPAESIAAVEPARGHLLLDTAAPRAPARVPRPSPERVAAARAGAARGGRAARTHAVDAARTTRSATVATASWVRPRARSAGLASARTGRAGVGRAATGVAWLAPRVGRGVRAGVLTAAELVYVGALLVARGGAIAARELERALRAAIEHASGAIRERRARQRS
jgi:hypothetical protein